MQKIYKNTGEIYVRKKPRDSKFNKEKQAFDQMIEDAKLNLLNQLALDQQQRMSKTPQKDWSKPLKMHNQSNIFGLNFGK